MQHRIARMLVALASMIYGLILAHAQSVNWADSYQYDNGQRPSVAQWDTTVVEVHQAGSGVGPLWYRVGQLTGSTVQWGFSYQYDNGEHPYICMSYDFFNQALRVVEVHQAADGSGPLWYRVGQVDGIGLTIQWAASHQYDDSGENPHCALWSVGVVEAHQAADGVGALMYRTGGILGPSFTTIQWQPSSQYDNGENPSIAQWNGDVVEVHQAGGGAGPLWTRAGQVFGFTVQWGSSSQYDNGENPSVALSFVDPERVVEVHQAGDGVGPLWYRAGTLSVPNVQWSNSFLYDDSGVNPSVSLYGNAVVEVHDAGDATLWYRVGTWQP